MGSTTFVKSSTPNLPGSRGKRRFNIDVPLLLIVITLLSYGLMMLYSASWDFAMLHNMQPASIFLRQLLWAVVGLVLAGVVSMIDYHFYKRLILIIIAVTVFLLILALIIGAGDPDNPSRGLFGGSVQPSELAKLTIVLYMSIWLDSRKEQIRTFILGFFPVMAILAVFFFLIFAQPDLSAAATVVLIGSILYFLAGADWRQITFTIAGLGILGWLFLKVYKTGAERLASYLAGLADLTKSNPHVMRAMEAVIRGGWFGVGIGQSSVKFTGLPVPHTDSIYAIVVEETGLIGASIVIILFGLLLWRGVSIARNAPDKLGSLLASGITFWIVIEAMLNMAVIIGLFPFAGNALPFFSSGGSNLVITLLGIGVLMNISRTNMANEAKDGSVFSAVVDLRRWNGRGRVPRAGSSPEPDEQD
jgi:cell division protein FtsW